ncbi:MAG: class I SAM-dependent methyltransferase [Clostridia bacterium]|nr:class I SAM-dependent methyltransferase [Clostridia bacterium]
MIDAVCIQGKKVDTDRAKRIAEKFGAELVTEIPTDKFAKYILMDKTGISFVSGKNTLKGDFNNMLRRVSDGRLEHEILLKATKPQPGEKAVDCTAGLGEDSFILAAAGYEVELFEHNPITALLLRDALQRAKRDPALKDIAARMTLSEGDSKDLLAALPYTPDLIYLDPMFPEKKKNAETKKKLQVLHTIELPCADEIELMQAAMNAKPKKIVVKRPPEGPFLAGIEPTYSVTRKAVRYDCIVL